MVRGSEGAPPSSLYTIHSGGLTAEVDQLAGGEVGASF
jgi:hypothetical protein